MLEKKLRLTLKRSRSGRKPKQTATIAALGLNRINQFVEVKDNLAIRGMLKKVGYLLKVEGV